uniref:ATP-binding cassette domain-containing protein n=2 Tax=unclassified Streptomyces TaxID=2593676 RepID=UPI000CD4AF84
MTSGGDADGGALLVLDRLVHGYGDRRVLRSVSLTVAPGECVAVLGHNGCGKTTLLRLAAGRETPTEGGVWFGGGPLDEDDPGTRARIATVLDAAAHYPDLTVREHLLFVALAHGLGEASEAAVAGVLADHLLDGHADALPSSLSSGQTQALLLAAAFVRPHELLLLDEPEQRLDTRARRALGDRLLAHKARGAAVLMASHDGDLAHRVADRVLVLDAGRTVVSRQGAVARPVSRPGEAPRSEAVARSEAVPPPDPLPPQGPGARAD